MTRISPTPAQRKRLFEANANRCCICKRGGVGLEVHHIDGDHANTVDENLAVLCVEDHDRHHRPAAYGPAVNHLEIGAEGIRSGKRSWEAFVKDARSEHPRVVATLTCYGTRESIHSLQLVMQWPDERIEYRRSFHLLDASPDRLTDAMLSEVNEIGRNIKLVVLSDPMPVDHCPCCGTGYSRTVRPGVVIRLTDPTWETDSVCSIYVNPSQPSLALAFALRDTSVYEGTLHLCRGKFLHFVGDTVDERVQVRARPSVRAQATRIVKKLLSDWQPATVLIGTGDHDAPTLIRDLALPRCWEYRTNRRRAAPTGGP